MKSIKLPTVVSMLMGSCAVLLLPLVSLAAEEEEVIRKEDINQIVAEATETAREWAYRLREYQGGKAESSTYMGIVIEPVPSVLRDYVDLPKGVGLLLPKIAKDGPADKAGLKDNDIIVSFDDQLVINISQLSTLIDMKGPGATVPVKVLRKGEELTLEVTLEERMRKGGHFFIPEAPDAPDAPEIPDMEDLGMIMEKVEEWIPGSVRIYVDQNEQVHVDLEDLREDINELRDKFTQIHVIKGDDPDIVTHHGDHGARTTMIRVAQKDVSYESDEGKVVLDSTEAGRQAMVWDAEGNLIYEGALPENYAEELPPAAVRLIDSLNDLELDTEGYQFEIRLNTEDIDPVTFHTPGE
ncbi:MAG: S1C family serine protease [Puniceicoccaceae bacterium]